MGSALGSLIIPAGQIGDFQVSGLAFQPSSLRMNYGPLHASIHQVFANASDGWINHVTAIPFALCRDAAAGTTVNNVAPFDNLGATASFAAGIFGITRLFFDFDLSAISGSVITATLNLYGKANADSDVSAQEGTQAIPITIADYDSFDNPPNGSEYGHVAWAINQYNQIPYNALGITNLDGDLGGAHKVCCREYTHDFLNVSPVGLFTNGVYFSEEPATDKDPFLEIETVTGGSSRAGVQGPDAGVAGGSSYGLSDMPGAVDFGAAEKLISLAIGSAATRIEGFVKSYNPDGFTIEITRNDLAAGLKCLYQAANNS